MPNVRGRGERVHRAGHERGAGVLVRPEEGQHPEAAVRGMFRKHRRSSVTAAFVHLVTLSLAVVSRADPTDTFVAYRCCI